MGGEVRLTRLGAVHLDKHAAGDTNNLQLGHHIILQVDAAVYLHDYLDQAGVRGNLNTFDPSDRNAAVFDRRINVKPLDGLVEIGGVKHPFFKEMTHAKPDNGNKTNADAGCHEQPDHEFCLFVSHTVCCLLKISRRARRDRREFFLTS